MFENWHYIANRLTEAALFIWAIAGDWIIWAAPALLLGLLAWPHKRRGRRHGRRQPGAKFRRHRDWAREATDVLARLKSERPITQETMGSLASMNPYAFEYLITHHFAQRGYDIRKIKRSSGDGGIDGMVHINGRWHLIQAKRYRGPVPRAMVASFAKVCADRRMPGMFITTSRFSASTIQQFRTHQPKLILVDGLGFGRLLG